MRLDKFISVNSAYSRNEIRLAARRGKITVNGVTEKRFDAKITPEDKIVIYDTQIFNTGNVYLLLNKPKGVLSASTDNNKQTVIDIIPEKYKHLDLFPVGRLDKDTTGLLIITNNGEFAHKAISPKNDVTKCYLVELDGEVGEDLIPEFQKGVVLADGTCCKSAKLEIIEKNVAKLTITEGKYHQVKRMFGVYDLGVNNLHRLSIGDLTIPENLKFGDCVTIDETEIMKKVLKMA